MSDGSNQFMSETNSTSSLSTTNIHEVENGLEAKENCSKIVSDTLEPLLILAIVGSRNFNNMNVLREHFDNWIGSHNNERPHRIVSGDATGVDALAARLAAEEQIEFVRYEADWWMYNRAAGPIRNSEIIKACTHVLALPCKNSRGTYDTIRKAIRAEKEVVIHKVDV